MFSIIVPERGSTAIPLILAPLFFLLWLAKSLSGQQRWYQSFYETLYINDVIKLMRHYKQNSPMVVITVWDIESINQDDFVLGEYQWN